MTQSYIIHWKSKINGRAGKGTKQFSKEEAERLVEELNYEYPQIHHEAIEAATQGAEEAPRVAAEPVAA